jgi:hypothetical protein
MKLRSTIPPGTMQTAGIWSWLAAAKELATTQTEQEANEHARLSWSWCACYSCLDDCSHASDEQVDECDHSPSTFCIVSHDCAYPGALSCYCTRIARAPMEFAQVARVRRRSWWIESQVLLCGKDETRLQQEE